MNVVAYYRTTPCHIWLYSLIGLLLCTIVDDISPTIASLCSTYGSSNRSPTSRLDKDCGLLHPTI